MEWNDVSSFSASTIPAAARPSARTSPVSRNRDRREAAHLVEPVERGVQLLGEPHGASGKRQRADEAHKKELDAVRRCGPLGGDSPIQDRELLALLALLHVFGELRFLVALEERLIVIFGGLVVP